MGAIHTVGPNKALVVSGGCFSGQRVRTVIGGWAWAWAYLSHVQTISLEVMTLNPTCRHVETTEGVPLTVTGVAQVKVLADPEFLTTACEQFLELGIDRIKNTILQTLEGHLRAILGTLTVEAVYKDRDQFATLVREVAAPDVGRMGIEILSFTIKDVFDDVSYLDSLGRPQVGLVKRDAEIGVAEAERDAGIREAECERERMAVRCAADAAIADYKRQFAIQKSLFDREVYEARAEADLANQLQSAIERQKICEEEVKVDIVQKSRQIEVEQNEVLLRSCVLASTVKEPALAEAFQISALAEGKKQATILAAQASADAIRLVGAAKASVVQALGEAEAEGLRLKAEAFAEFSQAAKLRLILDCLPSVAAEVCAPLAKTSEIVVLGGEARKSAVPPTVASLSEDLVRVTGTLPHAVRALSGVDLSKCIGRIPGATTVANS
ncbi:hypothetical protein AAHC03_09856 [Spirometra sp. Aus1]